MNTDFWYLFAAYLAILIVIFSYIFRLFRAQRKAQAELQTIRETLEKKG